jgi:predicted protein tyrosine phosphatase
MPRIYVSCYRDMPGHVKTLRPSHLVSVIGPNEVDEPDGLPPTPESIASEKHLKLTVHDIWVDDTAQILPTENHIEQLIAFGHGWERDEPLLVHCLAGVSRSTAAALTLLVMGSPGQEYDAAQLLRERAPHAEPNRLMIAIADEILGLDGVLVEAVREIGPGDYGEVGPLTELPARMSLHTKKRGAA